MKNAKHLEFKFLSSELLDRIMWLVGSDDLLWTYHLHISMTCGDRLRMYLQNIHNHVPDYTLS